MMLWHDYYRARSGREPNAWLVRAAARAARGLAVDLGFGDGVETRHLLARRWHVVAVDREPSAEAQLRRTFDRVTARLSGVQRRVSIVCSDFDQLTLPACDLVYAGYSLHTCERRVLAALLEAVAHRLRPGGRFVGHLLGERDGWAQEHGTTVVDRRELVTHLAGLEIEELDETERLGSSTLPDKRWHFYSVIARKP